MMREDTSSVRLRLTPSPTGEGMATGEGLVTVGTAEIGKIVADMMTPIMQSIAKMLENNTAALEQIAAAQSVQADRLEALERQVRLQTPVSAKQAAYLGSAAKDRARELLDRFGAAENTQAVRKLTAQIRKAVLARYGAAGLREIPAHEYSVAMSQIAMWNNVIAVREAARTPHPSASPTPSPTGEGIKDTSSVSQRLTPSALHVNNQPEQSSGVVLHPQGEGLAAGKALGCDFPHRKVVKNCEL